MTVQKAAASAAFQASQDDVESLIRRATALEAEAAAAVTLRQEVQKQMERAEVAETDLEELRAAKQQTPVAGTESREGVDESNSVADLQIALAAAEGQAAALSKEKVRIGATARFRCVV